MATHHVLLVPGFFGFDDLGDLAYFAHVLSALEESFRVAAAPVRLRVVATSPTASLRHRAAQLLDAIAAALAEEPGDVHLIGHSSGGLDARLAVTPEVSLPTARDPAPLVAHVRSVVTVATPHHGTPVASFFSSLLGQQLLGVFSLATSYALRTGRLPLDALASLVSFFVRTAAAAGGGRSPALDRLAARLLADFSPDRREALQRLVAQIGRDQDLLPQITPAAMDLFNASTDDRPGVRYGCVVTHARSAGVRSFASAGLRPYAHASHVLYGFLAVLASRTPADRVPTLTQPQWAALRRDLGVSSVDRKADDGIVPTLSQVHGQVIRAVWADHLDVIGHFHHPTHVPPHFDWLASGSGFSREAFLDCWRRVAWFVLGR